MKQLQKLVGEKCFLTPADGSVADIVAVKKWLVLQD